MSRGPLPSQLCLLSSLPRRPEGDKVRFLGCVTSYSVHTATLTVCHLYPRDTNVTVAVDVKLVLPLLTHETTQVGEWVNVMGYITPKPTTLDADLGSRNESVVAVQALLVWSTGPLNIQQYESTFRDAQSESKAVETK